MTELTEEQRIAIIRDAHQNSQSFSSTKSIEDFIAEVKLEETLAEHGTLEAQENDWQDEAQFFLTDSAEEIDEEDEDFGLSEEMRSVYKNN